MMELFGRDVLANALRHHADVRAWLARWVEVVEEAAWQNINDVRADYPSADGVKLTREVVVTVFNVKGNEYRLLTYVSYPTQTVEALELLTHAEYSKDRWKRRH